MSRLKRQLEGKWARFPWENDAPIRLGVSSCLLGHRVRWDGSHKRDSLLTGLFSDLVEWVPICPEVEVGMGVPREPVRLVGGGKERRLVGERNGVDYTRTMLAVARKCARKLEKLDVCGYVFKNKSPSCGLDHVRVYNSRRTPARMGRGLFADAIVRHSENLPVAEERALGDPCWRDNFVERVFAYRRLRWLKSRRLSLRKLVAFHQAHRFQLLIHSPAACQRLGRPLCRGNTLSLQLLRARYEAGLMGALSRPATRGRHSRLLKGLLRYFPGGVEGQPRAELLQLIREYQAGLLPLAVPLALMRNCAVRHGVGSLLGQVYLDPDPAELRLRTLV